MNFINDIKTETLIISCEQVKKDILNLKQLKPIKLMTLDEFKKMYLYSFNEEAVLFVMNEYNLKYEIAKEYILNSYYVTDKWYGVSKLDFLVQLKKKLDDNDLLIYNEYFKKYAHRVKIILYDLIIDDYTLTLFEGLDYQIISRECDDYKHRVIEFATDEDEVRYVAFKIADLINSGVGINNIKLTNVGCEYYPLIFRIFLLYGIPVNIPYTSSLASYKLVDEFIHRYRDGEEINSILEEIKCDSEIYDKLVLVINEYLKYESRELLIYKIEHSYITSKAYTEAIEIVDYLNYVSNDYEYIFMLNFNEGVIPKNHLDTAYITDNIVKFVGINTSSRLNTIIRDRTLKQIKSIKNLVITYKKSSHTGTFYQSTLSSEFAVETGKLTYDISYSRDDDLIRLVSEYDKYFKYGARGECFDVLAHNYMIKYNSYDNRFTGIKRDKNKLFLSYSKMNIYNKCAFRYYLANVLKLDVFNENFSAIIGRMVHYIMEKCLNTKMFSIDEYASEFLKDYQLTNKEMFFLEKYKEGIHKLLDQVMNEQKYTSLDKAMFEKRIEYDIDDSTKFSGIIDKIMYASDNDVTYVSLVDYKTGNEDISLCYFNDGINIQLPIYLYLVSKLDIKNPVYVGFYLQKFNLNQDDYRLEGYSNSDVEILEKMDSEYTNSKIIKGLKTNKDGSFSRYSKLISNEEIKKLLKNVDNQIHDVAKKIHGNEFTINPKVTNDKNIGCEYCQFKDICFKTKRDEVLIQESSLGE